MAQQAQQQPAQGQQAPQPGQAPGVPDLQGSASGMGQGGLTGMLSQMNPGGLTGNMALLGNANRIRPASMTTGGTQNNPIGIT
jgi:hypothetical protein